MHLRGLLIICIYTAVVYGDQTYSLDQNITTIPNYELFKFQVSPSFNLQSCAYPNGDVMVYVSGSGIIYGIFRDADAQSIIRLYAIMYNGTDIVADCHTLGTLQMMYLSSNQLIYSLLTSANPVTVNLQSGVQFKKLLNMNTMDQTYVTAIASNGTSGSIYQSDATFLAILQLSAEEFFNVDSSNSKYGKPVTIAIAPATQTPALTVYQCNMTYLACLSTTLAYPNLAGKFPSSNSFADYDNVMYWSFLDSNTTYLHIQSVPPSSNISFTYETPLVQQTIVAIGSDNHIVIFCGLSPNGDILLGTWDTSRSVNEVNVTFVGFWGADLLGGNYAISLVRIAWDTVQLSYVDNMLHGLIIKYSGSGLNFTENWPDEIQLSTNITINGNQTFLVNQSITIDTLVVSQNSTLVVQEGVVITVTGCADLAGTLRVILSNGTIIEAKDNTEIEFLVLNATCRSGEFESVETSTNYDLQPCEKLISKPNYSPTQVTILVSVDDSSCNISQDPSYDQTALIIGVCVAGAAVLIVGILLLAFYYSPLRAKVFPYAKQK